MVMDFAANFCPGVPGSVAQVYPLRARRLLWVASPAAKPVSR